MPVKLTKGLTGRRESRLPANMIPTTAISEADGGSLPLSPRQGRPGRRREPTGKWALSLSAGYDSVVSNFTGIVDSVGTASSPLNPHQRSTGEPPPPPPVMKMSCLLVPLVVAGWWYWTKKKARRVVALIRYHPREGRGPDVPPAPTPGDGDDDSNRSPEDRGDGRNARGARHYDTYCDPDGEEEACRDAYSSWNDVTCHESLDENQRFVLWIKGANRADDLDRHASLRRSQRSFVRGRGRWNPRMRESMLDDENGDSGSEDNCGDSANVPGNQDGVAYVPPTGLPRWEPIEDAVELSSIEVTDSTVTPWSDAHEAVAEMAERNSANSAAGYWGGGMPVAHLYDVGRGGFPVPWHGIVGSNNDADETDSGVYATCDPSADEFVGKEHWAGRNTAVGASVEVPQGSPTNGSSNVATTSHERDDKYVV